MASTKKTTAEEAAEPVQTTEPAAELTQAPAPESFTPYEARTRGMTAIRKTPDGPPIGTLPGGTAVRIVACRDGAAQMENGLYVSEALLEK